MLKSLFTTPVLLIFTVSLLVAAQLHPIHVSVMEVEHDRKSKAIETSTHVFIDDIETHLRILNKDKDLDIMQLSHSQRDKLLKVYFEDNIGFEINKKPAPSNYLGHEVAGEAFYIYIEVPNVKKLKSLKVRNTILLALYDDQANIIHFEHNESTYTEKLDNQKPSTKYVIDEL